MSAFRSVLVTGANRGIGLEFVKQFTKSPTCPIICATCRDPSKATELTSLASSNSSIHVLQFDVSDFASHETLASKVSSIVGTNGLDLLINNAGIYNKVSLTEGSHQSMIENLAVNSVSPLFITRAFLPLLRSSRATISDSIAPVVANITSKMGSIDDNTSGGHYAYRSSKAALNMVTKSLQVDLAPEAIKAVAIHPGWVLTDMGGAKAPISTETSVSNMVSTITKVAQGELGNDGKIFLNYDGTLIAW